ncbi:IS5 family transposase ISMac11 [Dictyobacter sp. S3.2.2.5]|uniref:IS5 family transposase ISMac11 n=1 Tax=Dictyobacter halimunensis TaxID=3026934 RepID=A0ABQ6FQJ5_9CHLR|nr:IS5 family transposase ISMac11 [Dictyobacter sp. S3.2.2.5]
MARTRPWKVSDALWEHVAPLIPPAPSHAKGGRPRLPDRQAFEAIVYVLRTGIQWNALPRELGASSTIHDRFQQWEQAGLFKALWQAGLAAYDELAGIQWEWQAADGTMSKAPFGGAATGPNPTDRGKQGTKRSLLTDGAGIPLALVIDGAQRHDVKLLSATLDGVVIERPIFPLEQREQLCLDAAYDSTPVYKELVARHYWPHVRSRGEERMEREIIPGYRARRWVVERTHAWLNRSRRILVRWEKKAENYLAFLHLACAQLLFEKVAVFG